MRSRSQATSARPAARAAGTAAAGRKARGLFGLGCVCVLGFAAFLGSGAPSVRRRRAPLLVLMITAASLLTLTPGALAAKTTINTLGTTATGNIGGFFNTPTGVAVNKTGNGGVPAGTFYVADQKNNRIQRFGPTGSFVAAVGWDTVINGSLSDPGSVTTFQTCTVPGDCKAGTTGSGAGQFASNGIQGITVDQATGKLYVADQGNRRISVFTATGTFEGGFGWGAVNGSAALQFCTTLTGCNSPAAAGSAAGQFGAAIGSLAVDSSSNLYVANKTSRRVDVFAPTVTGNAVTGISFTRAFGWGVDTGASAFEVCTTASACNAPAAAGTGLGQFGTNSPSDVAVDGSGNVYALDAANKRVQKFDSTPSPVTEAFGSAALSSAFGTGSLYNLSYDLAANHLYVSGSNSANSNKVAIAELDATGASVATHGTDLTATAATGLTAAPEAIGGALYLTTSTGAHRVFVLNDTRPIMDPVTIHAGTGATFTGAVVSKGIDVKYHFEYSADGSVWTKFPDQDVTIPATPGNVAVSQEVSGLVGSQLYRVRLVANRPLGGGETTSAQATFSTDAAAPTVSAVKASGIASTEAVLGGEINPQNQATTYHFEYVDDVGFQANGYVDATKVPAPDAVVGAGGVVVSVSRRLENLEPATTYHLRLLATNSTGTTASSDHAFRTFAAAEPRSGAFPGQGFLPDGRAWEMVSPPDKNGGDALPHSNRVRVADDGSAVSYISLTGFGDVRGTGVASEYMALRKGEPGTPGWTSHAILPAQESLTLFTVAALAGEPAYESEFSPDLDMGILRAWSPVAGATAASNISDVADAQNLYTRTDLRTPGAGSYQLITDCSICAGTPLPFLPARNPMVAGTSVDFRHVLFETSNDLVGAGSGLKVYAADDGIVRLVGLVPSGEGTTCGGGGPACVVAAESFAGSGATEGRYTPNAISDDGSRTFFEEVQFENNKLFLRDSQGTASTADDVTTRIDASERVSPLVHREATFENASADGSRVFFTTRESLTDSTPNTEESHLYMWNGDNAHNEEQKLTVAAAAGQFKLTFKAQTTTDLPFNATAAEVQSSLNALSTIGGAGGSVIVSGGPGNEGGANPYTIVFGGSLAASDQPTMTASAGTTPLAGGPASATVVPWVMGGGHLTPLSIDRQPLDLPGATLGVMGSSKDGSYVYFVTVGQIVAGEPVLNSARGIYLWHEGQVRYIGYFPNSSLDWIRNLNRNWALNPIKSRVTEDGVHLLFAATEGSGLTGYDHNSGLAACSGSDDSGRCTEFYLYDADSDKLSCVTCNPVGAAATASSQIDVQVDDGAANPASHLSHPLSEDGHHVFFTTGESLLPADSNGKKDVYEYDAHDQTVSLISSGESSSDSYFVDASPDGSDVFFVTHERLSRWDVDTSYDLYDARVGGGFPEPPSAPSSCAGDACQPLARSLNDPTPASSSFTGPSSSRVRSKAPCAKGRRVSQRPRGTHCVRGGKKRHHKRQPKRPANKNRRTIR